MKKLLILSILLAVTVAAEASNFSPFLRGPTTFYYRSAPNPPAPKPTPTPTPPPTHILTVREYLLAKYGEAMIDYQSKRLEATAKGLSPDTYPEATQALSVSTQWLQAFYRALYSGILENPYTGPIEI